MHGPTWTFWANLTPFSLQANPRVVRAVKHLVALSAGMASDAAFARQARRKFL